MSVFSSCRWCANKFQISDWDQQYLKKISPQFAGQTFLVPNPSLCPECRTKRRMSFRNERNLYRDTCDLCQKDTLSVFSPDKGYKVYCHSCWWSDNWNPHQYGREIDLNKDFFP